MLKRHSQLFEGLFTASDLLVVSFAWTLSYWIRFSWGYIPVEKGIPPFVDYLRMLLFVWLIWGFVFRRFGLYKPMRGVSPFREIWMLVKANTFSVILLLAVVYLFREKNIPFSRLVFLIFWVISTVSAVVSRSVIRAFLRSMRRRGYNLRYALIVGSGQLAARLVSRMAANPEFGIELFGCLGREKTEVNRKLPSKWFGRTSPVAPARRWREMTLWQSSSNLAVALEEDDAELELPIVGTYSELPKFLNAGLIDQIIVALPLVDHDRLKEVIGLIGDAMVDVKIVPDVHQFIQLGSEVEEFDGLPVVSLASTPLCGINRVFKRALDLILGVVMLVILSPLMLLLALAVKLTSRGPILFTQERVGLDGKRFNIYKFRTMRVDAEENGAQFAVRNDPRVTPIGYFLRRYNLDEFPQLVNVILGHMSLVGPRPERPVFIDEFRGQIPKYMLRHKVQAGMTGWAQVHGWRGNTSIEKRIEHDLYYIEHWSLLLDLRILFLTLVHSFRDRNAY